MTWTFTDSATPSDKDKVRSMIGDTDGTDATTKLLTDETINAVLAVQTNVRLAAATCCRRIAGTFARKASYSNGKLSTGAERYRQYMDMANELEHEGDAQARSTATIYVGGRAVSESTDLATDSSLTQPSFSVGMDDNRTGTTSINPDS